MIPNWIRCGRRSRASTFRSSSIRPNRRNFFSHSTITTSGGSSSRCLPSRRNNQPGQVTFDELMTERNNVFRKHPKTRFIAAHFGWHANDLGKAAAMLDAYPNVTVEVGAILYDLGRQPRAAHDFFVKYQDRILFGKDAFQPEEYPYYWRVFETRDEYFDYYRDYHAFWKLYGMDLPDAVLKKIYFQNALRVVKGLPRAGWPQ